MTYLPRNPDINCLGAADERLRIHNQTVNTIAVVLALGFAFLLGWVEINARRELRLARLGELAEGRVIERTVNKRRNRIVYWLRYQFDAPDGVGRIGWISVAQPLWEHLSLGTSLAVLHDPDDLDRHRPSFGFRFVEFATEPSPD